MGDKVNIFVCSSSIIGLFLVLVKDLINNRNKNFFRHICICSLINDVILLIKLLNYQTYLYTLSKDCEILEMV